MSKTFKRLLLKISGEIFNQPASLNSIIRQLIKLHKQQTYVAIVLGGGNIIRGRDSRLFEQFNADRAGMIATVINGIYLTDSLSRELPVQHFSAFPVGNFVDLYSIEKAHSALNQGKILILSGGTGNPFFSTDSAAALRAIELKMEIILKGTDVPGVFSGDPKKDPNAKFYPRLSYQQALEQGLKVMDLTAFTLCQQYRIPIIVFDITQPNAILNILKGKKTGSLIC